MTESHPNCASCGTQIMQRTADRRDGMCVPCFRNSAKPQAQRDREAFLKGVFVRIENAIEPFTDYRSALNDLRALPRGYTMCFAFHYVDAEISNGGISQLYANSTWTLILDAVTAAEIAGMVEVARVLKEMVYYYHKKGRSKLKRRLGDDYFAEMPDNWNKSLSDIEVEFFDREREFGSVIQTLCTEHQAVFSDP